MTNHILQMKGIHKSFSGIPALGNVDFQVRGGEIRALLGANGAGKSTLMKILSGAYQSDAGKIFIDNEEITRLPVYKRAQKGIGYLAQEASVFRHLSVEDNIKAVLEMTDFSHAEQKDKLENLLNEFSHSRSFWQDFSREFRIIIIILDLEFIVLQICGQFCHNTSKSKCVSDK